MERNCFFICLALLFHSCSAPTQGTHKDQHEYGYKGKVKVVVKKTFNAPVIRDNDAVPSGDNPAAIHTYYFSEAGNIDSTKTERATPDGGFSTFKTIYKVEGSKKSGWTAWKEDGEQALYAKIIWNTDKEYVEKVFSTDSLPRYEVVNTLNNSFRLITAGIKAFDGTGELIQNDVQKFTYDDKQNIESFKTTHQDNGSSEVANYQYFNIDKTGNLVKLVISKKGGLETKTLIMIDYVYY